MGIDAFFSSMQWAWGFLSPVLEILVLFFLIYLTLHYLRGTRGANVLAGIVSLLLILSILSGWANLEVISYLLGQIWSLLAIGLIVIFQPELRRAFAQIGSIALWRKTRKKEAISELTSAVQNMAKRQIGALIVIERRIGMRALAEDAVRLDIKLNGLIIESIFYPNSPLHDGAIIVRDDRIIAARVILPLTRNRSISRTMGTRHRAALGITEETDAVVIVVSEETGAISIASRGVIHREFTAENLERKLTQLLLSGERSGAFQEIFQTADSIVASAETRSPEREAGEEVENGY